MLEVERKLFILVVAMIVAACLTAIASLLVETTGGEFLSFERCAQIGLLFTVVFVALDLLICLATRPNEQREKGEKTEEKN